MLSSFMVLREGMTHPQVMQHDLGSCWPECLTSDDPAGAHILAICERHTMADQLEQRRT